MKNVKATLILSITLISMVVHAQAGKVHIAITPMFGTNALMLSNTTFKTNNTNNLQIEVLRFYISGIRFLKNGKVVLNEKNSFHLVDAAITKSLNISVDNSNDIDFDEIQFNLGIDSSTNVSGAMGGDLDPTKGMYWAWQSGYVNFKVEGKSNNCPTRNNEFEFHLGGYMQPNYSMQVVSLPVTNNTSIGLKFDMEKVFNQIDLANINHIMSPSAEAVTLTKIVAGSFSIINEN